MMDQSKFRDIEVSPGNAAVVVVDMENEFLRPEGKYYFGPASDIVIANTVQLLERCRRAGVPIIYVRSVRTPNDADFTRFGKAPYLMEGTSGSRIVQELTPRPGDPVVEKHSHDCFHNTEMDRALETAGILPHTHQIIVTGVASNVCVYHAVLGFHVRHYYTVVPMDCTTGTPGGNDIVISQFSCAGYDYNVSLTMCDRITFRSLAPLTTDLLGQ